MSNWSLGDVDGSLVLTDNDHWYADHVNEQRQSHTAHAVVGTTTKCQFYCDGVNDDVEINAALDYVNSLGGGTVYIKAGTYNITTAIQKDYANISIIGDGMGKTILKYTATSSIWIMFLGNVAGTTIRENIRVEGITFDMNNKTDSYGLGISWCANVIVRDCSIINRSTTSYLSFLLGKFTNTGGVDTEASWNAKNYLIDSCFFENVSTSGGRTETVSMIYARNVKFNNCTFSGFANTGALLNYSSEHVIIQGCHFKLGATLGIGGRNTIVNGCSFADAGILIWDAHQVKITGCTFRATSDWIALGYGGANIGIQGYYFAVGASEPPLYYTLPYAWQCKDIVIEGNVFWHSNVYAIGSSNFNDGAGTYYTGIYNIKIIGNTFNYCNVGAINVFAKYAEIKNNSFVDGNQSNTGGYDFFISGACNNWDISENVFEDTTGFVTNDIRVNQNSYSDYVASVALKMDNNRFSKTVPILYYTGAAWSATIQANITVEGSGNKYMNPEVLYAQGNVTGNTTFDRANGEVITATLTGSITVTLTNGKVPGDELTLILTQGGTGSYTYTKTASNKLAGGSVALTAAVGSIDVLKFRWNGTVWNEVSRSLANA